MIADFDDAYTNAAYILNGADYPDHWAQAAATFRSHLPAGCSGQFDLAYGSGTRNKIDLFLPPDKPKGLSIFIHGGYWMRFRKDHWSHLARGALLRGWAVAIPGYTLTPEVRIAQITQEITFAIQRLAARVAGPIRLAGHSAGGHLATRVICRDTALAQNVASRIVHVTSISGLHDLRPLLRTEMNVTLQLSDAEATSESPALLQPLVGIPITCWVGEEERPEFIRQSDLLANVWTGLGVSTQSLHIRQKHHFDIIEDLTEPESALTMLLGP
jgi:arylformamidase